MINKNKILKAIKEGIKTGFKFSSNDTRDNSSIIDFSDSKINVPEALNIDLINKKFRQLLDEENIIDAYYYIDQFGADKITEKYKVTEYFKGVHSSAYHNLKTIISDLVGIYGPNVDLNWIDIHDVLNMQHMFLNSNMYGFAMLSDSYLNIERFNGDISKWDVRHITDMTSAFENSDFNGDISKWQVYNVKDMSSMFKNSKFNGDLSEWQTERVEYMDHMFENSVFNQDISEWNVDKVCNFKEMFKNSLFNQDISDWNVDGAEHFDIFYNCPIEDKNKPMHVK